MAEDRNFFQRMFGLGVKPEIKQNSNMMGYFGVGAEAGKDYKYQDLAKEGYLNSTDAHLINTKVAKTNGQTIKN